MTTFDDLLDDIDGLCRALSAIEPLLTAKQREHLRDLFLSPDGESSQRVGKNVLKSRTRWSCSKVGGHLTRYFEGVGASDQMMWIGYIALWPDGTERWVMRSQIREALRRLNWFGSESTQSGSALESVAVKPDQQTDIEARAERFALIRVRTEQAAFRTAVFKACGGRCLISGSPVPEVLEAAHLKGRTWQEGHNSAQDGILLRRDLHALYDNALLTIDNDGRVGFDESISSHYPEFRGRVVLLPASTAARQDNI